MRVDNDSGDVIAKVMQTITEFYGVDSNDVVSQRRSALVHQARCMGMYLAKKNGADTHEIGRSFGRRDHTIVEAVCRNMVRKVAEDAQHAALVHDLESLRTTR